MIDSILYILLAIGGVSIFYRKITGKSIDEVADQIIDTPSSLLNSKKNKKVIENNSVKSKNKADNYEIDNSYPAFEQVLGTNLYKRDLSGLKAYFAEMTNMKRLFTELTHAIRNGFTVEKYLHEANLMNDPEIKQIVARGFSDVATFLEDMLEIKDNDELKKDYNACLEAIKILRNE